MDRQPATLAWLGTLMATLVLVSRQGLPELYFVYVPTGRWWRLVLFAYIGPFSIDFAVRLYFMWRYLLLLERNFCTEKSSLPRFLAARERIRGDEWRLYDFAWFVGVCMASVVLTVSLVNRFLANVQQVMLGPVLEGVLMYVWCKLHQNEPVLLRGIFPVQGKYLPWAYMLLRFLFSEYYPQVLKVYALLGLVAAAKAAMLLPPVSAELICIAAGHIVWFFRFFYLEYFDEWTGDWGEAHDTVEPPLLKREVRTAPHTVALLLFTPPWYYF